MYESTAEVEAQYGHTILDGPFRGMKYPIGSLLSRHGIPIIFGTYELELHQIIEEVVSNHYDKIIDIGCAEGYYAVGLALRTDVEVHAFDCEPRERSYCRRMARENNVAVRVHVKSWCSEDTLKRLAVGRCLIISDCEGFEASLFSSSLVAALKNSDLIIELHQIDGINVRDVLMVTIQGFPQCPANHLRRREDRICCATEVAKIRTRISVAEPAVDLLHTS